MGGHDLGVTSPDRAAGRTSGLGEARLLAETAFGAYVCRRGRTRLRRASNNRVSRQAGVQGLIACGRRPNESN